MKGLDSSTVLSVDAGEGPVVTVHQFNNPSQTVLAYGTMVCLCVCCVICCTMVCLCVCCVICCIAMSVVIFDLHTLTHPLNPLSYIGWIGPRQ
jgi:hypothetical protein